MSRTRPRRPLPAQLGEPRQFRRLWEEWAGWPHAVAEAFGVDATALGRYLIRPYTGFARIG